MAIGTPTSVGDGFAANSATTVAITSATAGVGDLVIVICGDDGDAAHPPSSVTDSAGNTYVADTTAVTNSADYLGRVFSSVLTSALTAGTITVTYAGKSGTWDKYASAVKVTGSWDSSRKDKTATGSAATGAAWDSGNTATTTVAAELVFGYGVMGKQNNGTTVSSTPGANLTELRDVNTGALIAYSSVYRIVAATAAYKANGTWAGLTTRPWGSQVVTYKEAAGGGTAWTLTPSDTITLSDAVVKGVGLGKADTITLSDTLAKNLGLGKSDTITMTDVFGRTWTIVRTPADTINLSDALGKNISHPVADTITLSDAVAKGMGLSKADSLTLADAVTKGIGLGKADSITLTDALAKAFGKKASDTITLSDTITKLLNGFPPDVQARVIHHLYATKFGFY